MPDTQRKKQRTETEENNEETEHAGERMIPSNIASIHESQRTKTRTGGTA